MHHRLFPKQNSFKYTSCYIAFPAKEPALLKNKLFTLDKFNLFSLYKSDYGVGDKHNLTTQLDNILTEHGINNINKIILVTHPRLLGYAFNPVSFWLCFDADKNLIATLSEVTNTCKQKHNYLCFKDNYAPIQPSEWLEAKKEFYVSPFMKIEGYYKFRFEITESQFHFFINYFVDDKLKLATYLKCKTQKFSNKNLLLSFLKVPCFTLKTTLLIYYQATKLYLKSIKYYPYPKKLKHNLTVSKNGK
jgi:uncharacterized protein